MGKKINLTQDEIYYIIELRNKKLSIDKISKLVNLSTTFILKILNENKVKVSLYNRIKLFL